MCLTTLPQASCVTSEKALSLSEPQLPRLQRKPGAPASRGCGKDEWGDSWPKPPGCPRTGCSPFFPVSRADLAYMAATSCPWWFTFVQLKLNKVKNQATQAQHTSHIRCAPLDDGHTWPVATILDSAESMSTFARTTPGPRPPCSPLTPCPVSFHAEAE